MYAYGYIYVYIYMYVHMVNVMIVAPPVPCRLGKLHRNTVTNAAGLVGKVEGILGMDMISSLSRRVVALRLPVAKGT